jgi:clan AA aspartic protease (TIGR02281 family)
MISQRAVSSLGMAITFTIGLLSGSGQTMASVERPTHDLPTPDLQAPSRLFAPGRTIERDPDGLFRVDAGLNGMRARLIVDTGANVTVLSTRDAARLGLSARRLHFDEVVEAGGGRVAAARVLLADARILDRDIRNVPVIVARGNFPASVMGQDLLARLGPLAIDGDRLAIDPIVQESRKNRIYDRPSGIRSPT